MNNELPAGWADAALLDLVDVLDARRVPLNAKERANRPGPYPYYGANGQVGTIDEYLFEGEHILVAEDGGYFDDQSRPVAYRVDGRFWVNNHAHILKARGGIPVRFLEDQLNVIDWMGCQRDDSAEAHSSRHGPRSREACSPRRAEADRGADRAVARTEWAGSGGTRRRTHADEALPPRPAGRRLPRRPHGGLAGRAEP
jgi:hypothetical protein